MNSRQRFLETLNSGAPDRVPLFGEGMRPEVYRHWNQHDLCSEVDLKKHFAYDVREEIPLDVEPHPAPQQWPSSLASLDDYHSCLNPEDLHRMPRPSDPEQGRTHPLLMRIHEGFFLSMGVRGWERFNELMYLCTDAPDFVGAMMALQGEFVAQLLSRVLDRFAVDAVIFSEPISGNHGPLISPHMYQDFVLASYRPVMKVLLQKGVEHIILRTYANARVLLSAAVEFGFNALWACETDERNMDYLDIRAQFGPGLRLIGGLDTDVLLKDQAAIHSEVVRVVPPLLEQGGYIPLLDGRVREYVPYENYCYYRKLLEEIVLT